MKRLLVAVIILGMSVCAAFCGCHLLDYESDNEVAESRSAQFVAALDSGDKEQVKALFAPNKAAGIENFDDKIDALMDYYVGTSVQLDGVSNGSERDNDYGDVRRWVWISCNVVTTQSSYRMAFYWCVEDDYDGQNIGAWSYSVICYDDVPFPEDVYWGTVLSSTECDISIGSITSMEWETLEDLIKRLGNGEYSEYLFAPAHTDSLGISAELSALGEYFDGQIEYHEMLYSEHIVRLDRESRIIYRVYDSSFKVGTSAGDYFFAMRACSVDDDNEQNVGIWSLYVTKDWEGDGAYFGDGLWTDGIHIVQ